MLRLLGLLVLGGFSSVVYSMLHEREKNRMEDLRKSLLDPTVYIPSLKGKERILFAKEFKGKIIKARGDYILTFLYYPRGRPISFYELISIDVVGEGEYEFKIMYKVCKDYFYECIKYECIKADEAYRIVQNSPRFGRWPIGDDDKLSLPAFRRSEESKQKLEALK